MTDAGLKLALVFLAPFFACLFVTPLLRRLARQRGWLDHPDLGRKTHEKPVPRIGGVGIYLAFLLGLALAPLGGGLAGHYWPLGVASGAVMLIGLADDIRGVSPTAKIVVQLAGASYLYLEGWRVSLVTTPFGDSVSAGLLSFPITVLWFVSLSNAFNLIDGLDGLAAGVAFFSLAALSIGGLHYQRFEGAAAAFALGGALLGFLPYNFSPASVFLGDSGSLFVGFAVAALAISNSMKASAAITIVAPLLALAIPILDAFLAVVRRTLAGKHIFAPDREHIHHKLLQKGFTPRRAVLLLYAVSALFSALSFLAMTGPVRVIALAVLLVVLLVVVGVAELGYLQGARASLGSLQGRERSER